MMEDLDSIYSYKETEFGLINNINMRRFAGYKYIGSLATYKVLVGHYKPHNYSPFKRSL